MIIEDELCTIIGHAQKLLTSLVIFGKEASCITLTFPGSGKIPFDENTKPKNVREFLLSSHFLCFRVRPTCICELLKNSMQRMIMVLLTLSMINDVITDVGNSFNLLIYSIFNPSCVAKIVMYLLSLASTN